MKGEIQNYIISSPLAILVESISVSAPLLPLYALPLLAILPALLFFFFLFFLAFAVTSPYISGKYWSLVMPTKPDESV